MDELRELYLYDMDGLTGSIPSEWSELKKIERLLVYSMENVGGDLPASFGALSTLKVLSFSQNNKMTGMRRLGGGGGGSSAGRERKRVVRKCQLDTDADNASSTQQCPSSGHNCTTSKSYFSTRAQTSRAPCLQSGARECPPCSSSRWITCRGSPGGFAFCLDSKV